MYDVFIFDTVRTPRGKGKNSGSLYTVRPVELLATVLSCLKERNQFDTKNVDDVVIGCVTQINDQGENIARFAVLEAGYDEQVPGVTLNRFCASGLESVNQASAMIASGYCELIVAGGVESMSRVKIGSDGGCIFDTATQWNLKGSVPQGISADLLATLRDITREQADEFALLSQQRACKAIEKGLFNRSIIPVKDKNGFILLDKDELPRSDTDLDKLSALKPAFELFGTKFALNELTKERYGHVEKINHIHTAGNSSGIVDGACAILLGSEQKGRELGLKPRGIIKATAVIGDDPTLMLDGPIPVTRKILQKANMLLSDIDLFEVNEAFAAVPLAYIKHFDIDPNKVNVNGGAISLGHPIGATGSMLVGTILDSLEDKDLTTGLVTLCVGGGMGIAAIVERI